MNRQQQQQGVALLHHIYQDPREQDRKRECLLYLALAQYKLGAYMEARKYTEQLLAIEPGNIQAKELERVVEDKITREGVLGMAIVGTVVGVVALGLASILRRH